MLQGLPKGLRGIYPIFFARRFPDEADYERTKRVLQVMVAAREPLSEAQLAGATGLDDEEELPGVLRRLTPFLVRRQSKTGEVLALYHKSLLDWLTDKQLRGSRFYISPRIGHEQLAEWGWKEFQQDTRKMSRYTLRHLPAYLLETDRWDDLAAVLTDLFFLEAKAEAGFVFELAADFGAALKGLPKEHTWYRRLGLLEEAMGLDLPFLARHPSALFQTLWNRCWWYDCAQAAKHYWRESAGIKGILLSLWRWLVAFNASPLPTAYRGVKGILMSPWRWLSSLTRDCRRQDWDGTPPWDVPGSMLSELLAPNGFLGLFGNHCSATE